MVDAPATSLMRANELLSQFKLQQALNEAEHALASLEGDRLNIDFRAQAHEIAGKAAIGLGRYPLAEEHLRQAVLLYDELEASKQLLACQLALAESVIRQGQFQPARHLANAALQKAQQENWQQLIANSLICLGNIAWAEGDVATALNLLWQAIELFDSLAMPREASRARCSLGVVYSIAGDQKRAIEQLHLALEHFQQQHDYTLISRCLNNLAGIAFTEADYSRAREYLLQCVDLETEIGARGDMSPSWFNLGLIELSEPNTKLAKKYFHRAMQLAREAGDRGMEGSALFHLGIAALFENENAEAFNLAQLSASVFEGSSSQRAQALRLYMPVFLLAEGNIRGATAAWAKQESNCTRDRLELRTMTALLANLAVHYYEADAEITRGVRELAKKWHAQLRLACEG